jgi:hypothetical protein
MPFLMSAPLRLEGVARREEGAGARGVIAGPVGLSGLVREAAEDEELLLQRRERGQDGRQIEAGALIACGVHAAMWMPFGT